MSDDIQDNLKVIRGNPSPEQLAALIAIIESAVAEERAAGKKQLREPRSTWNRNVANLRGGIVAGAGQWSAAFRDGLS